MKLKNVISLITIFFSLNTYSQTIIASPDDMLSHINSQLKTVFNNPELSKTINIESLLNHIDENKENLPELRKISKELQASIAGGKGTICIC